MSTNESASTDNTSENHEPANGGTLTQADATSTAQAVGSVAELPEWAQQELSRARSEAAKYRRERNTLQKSLQDKDTSDTDTQSRGEIERLTGELDAAQRDAAKLRAALAADIPPPFIADFAARLVGDTDDELLADAQRLRELIGPPDRRRPDPSQGEGRDTHAESPADAFAAFISDRLS